MAVTFRALGEPDWLLIPDSARPRWCADTKGIAAQNDKGELLAVCVLDTWTANSCMIHIWIDNPIVLKHGFSQTIFDYVFNTCNRNVIIGVTPSDNPLALRFIRHIGFVDTGVIPDGHERGVDFIITTLRKENCRWIPQPEGTDNG
jgi:RimJ/RimL family protein N-acetyltransferase